MQPNRKGIGSVRIFPAPLGRKQEHLPTDAGVQKPPAVPWARKKGRSYIFGSYVLGVLLPTFLVILYYLFIAADQYMVETRFAVRSTAPSVRSGLLETLGIGLGGAAAGDTYIVREYIHSREIVKRIDRQLDLRKRFMKPQTDFYAALQPDSSFEDLLEYWRSMVTVELDRVSHILTIRTFAFTPEDARDIATAILKESERMINDLSERARQDAVAYAENEVRKAEERLRKIRKEFLKFRSSTQQIDPAKQAAVQVALIGKLEEQLAQMRAKLAEARNYLSSNAPTIIFLKNRIKALERQITDEKRKLGDERILKNGKARNNQTLPNKDTVPLSTTLSEYEALLVEREFAEKFYVAALSGLEEARVLANRQQRYLATFVNPYLPEEALYPKKVRNTIFVFLTLTLIWALSMLMIQSVRDRM